MDKIRKGEYVPFHKLLLPPGHPYPLETNKSRRKQPKRVVNSLSLWLEAWNRFAGVLIAHKPEKALELAQYQTLLCMAFERYPHEACVEYDSCFQARINNYVGTSTRKISSFGVFHQNQRAVHRAPMPAHGSLATPFVPDRYYHVLDQRQRTRPAIQQQEMKFASDSICHEAAPEVQDANTNTCATRRTVEESTLLASAASRDSIPLRSTFTPLRYPQFEEELRNHPDQTWVKELLHNIDNGVSLGYHGPRCQRISRNLVSSAQFPQAIDDEIQKELRKKRLVGPFDEPPLPNLQCSGVGVIPKKTGGWRMIMHLSAPHGQSINDGISKEEFTLRYSRIDDAIRLINLAGGKGALLAKVDLKSAFRIIPVRREDRELLGMHWRDKFYVDRCLPFGLRSAPFLFNKFAQALEWILHNNYSVSKILHYLDDFLLVGSPTSVECQQALTAMLTLCAKLGFPIAPDKLEGPAQLLTFLGTRT